MLRRMSLMIVFKAVYCLGLGRADLPCVPTYHSDKDREIKYRDLPTFDRTIYYGPDQGPFFGSSCPNQ